MSTLWMTTGNACNLRYHFLTWLPPFNVCIKLFCFIYSVNDVTLFVKASRLYDTIAVNVNIYIDRVRMYVYLVTVCLYRKSKFQCSLQRWHNYLSITQFWTKTTELSVAIRCPWIVNLKTMYVFVSRFISDIWQRQLDVKNK